MKLRLSTQLLMVHPFFTFSAWIWLHLKLSFSILTTKTRINKCRGRRGMKAGYLFCLEICGESSWISHFFFSSCFWQKNDELVWYKERIRNSISGLQKQNKSFSAFLRPFGGAGLSYAENLQIYELPSFSQVQENRLFRQVKVVKVILSLTKVWLRLLANIADVEPPGKGLWNIFRGEFLVPKKLNPHMYFVGFSCLTKLIVYL